MPPAPGTGGADVGRDMLRLAEALYPLPRSLTGEGSRDTLRKLGEIVPIDIHEVPTGTPVFDWEVPPEWNVRAAWLEHESGKRVADFERCNLHLVGYSVPVDDVMDLDALQAHLHSDPERPDVIPYRTSYYARNWGFCLSHRQREALPAGRYRVRIDTQLAPGSLSYGEVRIPGALDEDVVVYTHTCHPALANDNLSGIAVCAYLAQWLAGRRNRLGYRIVFGPGTIGSLVWLAENRASLDRVRAGLVVVLAGLSRPLVYKRSFGGCSPIDRAADAWLATRPGAGAAIDFSPWGYDERQFNAPGFRLPVGRLSRATEEGYPEYHSSADNLSLLSASAMEGTLHACRELLEMVDANRSLVNLSPCGEPQLGRRGLYRRLGGPPGPVLQRALLWVLSYGDGKHDLIDVHARSGVPYDTLVEAVDLLHEAGLIE